MSSDNEKNGKEERKSEDSEETLSYLDGLIKDGTIGIEEVLIFFNYACGAYKEASRVIDMSGTKINIEFNYAARAFASFISEKDDGERRLALLDAFQASRHIINDSLDIILGEIEDLLVASTKISEERQIEDFIENYDALLAKKEEIHAIVSKSRRKRGYFRYEAYLGVIKGESYKQLLAFLIKIKRAIDQLSKTRLLEQRKNRKNLFLTLTLFLVGVVLTVLVGLFPDEFKSFGGQLKILIISKVAPIGGAHMHHAAIDG